MKRTFTSLMLLAVTVVPVTAGVEQIVTDLKPLAGYIVMDMQSEYIIDLDASHGIRVGDIFAAVSAGKKIIHPVTGEVLGTLDQIRAQLRVSKVKSGYSYAVSLPGSSKLKAGDAIQRFQGIPATFWDYSGEGENFYTELQAGLPALEWLDYASGQAQKPERPQKVEGLEGLIFILTGKGLAIKDAVFQPIRFYSRADLSKQGIAIAATQSLVAAPVAVPIARGAAVPKTKTGFVAASKPVVSAGSGIARTAAIEPDQGVWYGPDMTGEIVAIEAVDLDVDGQIELAIAFPNKIILGSMTGGQYQGQGFIDMPERMRILGVDAADLDHNGKPELYISAVKMDDSIDQEVVASMVADEINGQLQIIADDIPFLLSRADLPEEGTVIIAQRVAEEERTYGGKVYRLQRKGKKFKRGKALDYKMHKLTVHGFTPFKSDGETLIALFDINERLEIYNLDGERLWADGDIMGGSQSFIERTDPISRADNLHYYLKARLATRTDGTVLVPLNEGDSRSYGSRKFSESRLVAMQWDGHAMKELGTTEPQGGYLADFRVADVDNDGQDEIIMGILYSQGGGMMSKVRQRSALVVYELQ